MPATTESVFAPNVWWHQLLIEPKLKGVLLLRFTEESFRFGADIRKSRNRCQTTLRE